MLEPGSWAVEGIGEDFVPPNADLELVSKAYAISDRDALRPRASCSARKACWRDPPPARCSRPRCATAGSKGAEARGEADLRQRREVSFEGFQPSSEVGKAWTTGATATCAMSPLAASRGRRGLARTRRSLHAIKRMRCSRLPAGGGRGRRSSGSSTRATCWAPCATALHDVRPVKDLMTRRLETVRPTANPRPRPDLPRRPAWRSSWTGAAFSASSRGSTSSIISCANS